LIDELNSTKDATADRLNDWGEMLLNRLKLSVGKAYRTWTQMSGIWLDSIRLFAKFWLNPFMY
jgi:hypothetical protein